MILPHRLYPFIQVGLFYRKFILYQPCVILVEKYTPQGENICVCVCVCEIALFGDYCFAFIRLDC